MLKSSELSRLFRDVWPLQPAFTSFRDAGFIFRIAILD